MSNKIIQKCSICGQAGHKKSFHIPIPKEKYCNGCNKNLPANEFYLITGKNKNYLSCYCKKCDVKNSHKRYIKSIESRLKRLFLSVKHRAEKRGQIFTILEQDLLNQYNKQNGKCYYTGEPLSLDIGKKSISIDRLNSKDGYTKENIVFTSWRINHMKNNDDEITFLDFCGKIWNYRHTS